MADWEIVALGDIAELSAGATPPRGNASYWADNGNPWATIADLNQDPVLVTSETVSDAGMRFAGRIAEAGSLLMSFKLTIGRVARAGIDLQTNEAIVSVCGTAGVVEDDWLYHALPQLAASGVTDVAVKGATLNHAKLRALTVSLPPLDEQRRIAEILDTIDETIRATERVIAKLWQTRDGALEHELATIDDSYRRRSLLDVISVASGQVDPRVEPYSSLTLVGPDHIEGEGRGRILAQVSASAQGAISGKYQFGVGDVVYSKIRPELRKAWLATFSGLCSADMYPLSPHPRVISGYLASVILGQRFSRFAVSVSARSSGMPKVNRSELAEFAIAIPPFEVQQTVVRIGELHTRRIERERASLRKINEIRHGLLDDLLSGKTRTVAA